MFTPSRESQFTSLSRMSLQAPKLSIRKEFMTGRQCIHILLIAGFVSWIAAQSQAQTYSMKALGVGPPTQIGVFLIPRINNSGQVVGNRSSGGYLYSGGLLTALP